MYTNIPQVREINTVCKEYEAFEKNDTPIPITSCRMAGHLRILMRRRGGPFKHERSIKAPQLERKGTNLAKFTH